MHGCRVVYLFRQRLYLCVAARFDGNARSCFLTELILLTDSVHRSLIANGNTPPAHMNAFLLQALSGKMKLMTTLTQTAPTQATPSNTLRQAKPQPKETAPIALVVFLENVGHISGMSLPQWAMNIIDYVTEEYAKIQLHLLGVHRCYDRVIILEDAEATGHNLMSALTQMSRTHLVDVLLLVHGHEGMLVGHLGKQCVDKSHFDALQNACVENPSALNLRMVYGVNCYGASLAPTWLALGAQAVNGAVGVNWLPEPSITIFLRNWLKGEPYSDSVRRANLTANRFWRRFWKPSADGRDHSFIETSRQIVFGQKDITIHSDVWTHR